MKIDDVMDDIATRLRELNDLNVLAYDADDIEYPAAMISLPIDINYLGTYGRGMDTMTLMVTLLVSDVGDAISRNQISKYADGEGDYSIKEHLENGKYISFDVLAVQNAFFDVITIGRSDYLGCKFKVFISGQGN